MPRVAMPDTAAETLAGWASWLQPEALPAEVVHQARRCVVDHLAAVLAGSRSEPARIVREHLAATEGRGASTVIGGDLRLSAANAAFANGTAAHALEVDDGHTRGAFHPGAAVLPAVLAVAEQTGATMDDLLVAVVVAYEVSCRVAEAGHPATRRRGFHNTSVAGVFGAAAGAARLLGADTVTLANALGIAGSQAGGLFEFLATGAETKRIHAGNAARGGVVAAELAARGLTGPVSVFEGVDGYGRAFAGDDFRIETLVAGLGTSWSMLDTYLKPYPCCRHLHGPIEAVQEICRSVPGLAPEQVDSITVETYEIAARHDATAVDTLLDAQMSMPFAVATTLRHGSPALAHFEAGSDVGTAAIMERVEVVVAPDLDAAYPRTRAARVTIRAGGDELVHQVDQPYGEPSRPLSDADLSAKFRMLVEPVLGPDGATRLLAGGWDGTTVADLLA